MPSIVQFEHVTSPSAVMWYLCITSHRTFLALHAAQAFAALLLTGFGFPLMSTPAADCPRFFEPESVELGDCEALEPLGSIEFSLPRFMMSTALWYGEIGEACDPVETQEQQITSLNNFTFEEQSYGAKSYNAETDIRRPKIRTDGKTGG
jgi:hypothetical protein